MPEAKLFSGIHALVRISAPSPRCLAPERPGARAAHGGENKNTNTDTRGLTRQLMLSLKFGSQSPDTDGPKAGVYQERQQWLGKCPAHEAQLCVLCLFDL